MEAVTLSPKFQIVIPPKVRKALHVKPGQKMRMLVYDNQVILILYALSKKREDH